MIKNKKAQFYFLATIADIEETKTSLEVWNLLVSLGKKVDLPFIDFISASSYTNWKKTLFTATPIRGSTFSVS